MLTNLLGRDHSADVLCEHSNGGGQVDEMAMEQDTEDTEEVVMEQLIFRVPLDQDPQAGPSTGTRQIP